MKLYPLILILVCFCKIQLLFAQSDKKELNNVSLLTKGSDTIRPAEQKKDSLLHPRHIPRIATRRSAMIPGWGQAYNHEYWKIPIVYGALAIPTYTFFYNNSYYKIITIINNKN
jgi:hypothetical protein